MEKEPKHKWHGSHHYSDKLHLLFVVFLFLGIITIIFSYFMLNSSRIRDGGSENPSANISPVVTPTPVQDFVACTQDAKQCPDGSFVGRVAPSCEFEACPRE